MNLIDESFQTKEENNKKTAIRIVLVAIILVVIAIIGIISYMAYIKSKELKVTLDGSINNDVKKILIFEDETVYVPIKRIAQYLQYDSFNGDYFEKSESNTKCYVESEREIASFELNSNKIYKLDLDAKAENYSYVYSKKPIKSINGELCATSEAIEKAFNVSFTYDQEKNSVTIYTLPYLVSGYSPYVLDWGYEGISESLANQKAILQNMIVVKNKNKRVGVIDVNNKQILEMKYSNIEYLPTMSGGKDFLVEDNGKVGVISSSRETKVELQYDSIKLLDLDAKLYVVSREGKYGVIDQNGNTKIYIENDAIGIDISKFKENGIRNQYILANNLIPARKNDKWGLYSLDGNQVVDFEYDSLGYTASSSKNALNLLVIPDYNVLVACQNKKYTLINNIGEQLIKGAVADDIYMIIDQGKKQYLISFNNQTISATDYLDQFDVNMTKNTNIHASNNQNKDKQNGENNSNENSEELNNDNQNNNGGNNEEINNDDQNNNDGNNEGLNNDNQNSNNENNEEQSNDIENNEEQNS